MEQRNSNPTVLEQRRALVESGDFQRELLNQLVTPKTIEAIDAFLRSPAVQKIGEAIRYMQRPEVQAALQAIIQKVDQVLSSPQVGDAIRAIATFNRAAGQLAGSPLAEYLSSGRGPDIGQLVEGAGVADISVKATGDGRVIRTDEIELERQIVGHLESGNAVSTLSSAQKLHLWFVISLLVGICNYLALQNGIREELCFLQPKLLPAMTMNQVGKSIRSAICNAEIPSELLREFRSVKGDGVHLRTEPRLKSSLVQVDLPDRSTLHVLDDSNRDWLYVAVVGEDGVEGWISRKYTHPLHK